MTNKPVARWPLWFEILETAPNILAWPRGLRRLFLFTLPVSVPLYLLMMAVLGVGLLMVWVVLAIMLIVMSVWLGENLFKD